MLINSKTDLAKLNAALEKIIAQAPSEDPTYDRNELFGETPDDAFDKGQTYGEEQTYYDVAKEIRNAIG